MDDQISAGIKRLNSLLTWWQWPSVEDKDSMSNQINRFQTLLAELQEAYLEAAQRHMDAILATNDKLARAAQGLLKGQKPEDAMAAQAAIVTIVIEAASEHAETWADLQRKVIDHSSMLSSRRETAAGGDVFRTEPVPGAARPKPKESRPPVKGEEPRRA